MYRAHARYIFVYYPCPVNLDVEQIINHLGDIIHTDIAAMIHVGIGFGEDLVGRVEAQQV